SAPAALPAERQSTLDQGRPKVDRGFISVAEVKIIDAVSLSQVSVRLLNGINQAQELNKLPVQTIGAYWVGHPETEKQFLNLSNLGKKSVCELTTLLEKWNDAARDATDRVSFACRIGLLDLSVLDQPEEIGISGHFPVETDIAVVSPEC